MEVTLFIGWLIPLKGEILLIINIFYHYIIVNIKMK